MWLEQTELLNSCERCLFLADCTWVTVELLVPTRSSVCLSVCESVILCIVAKLKVVGETLLHE